VSGKPLAELTELGQARRLRPLAAAALRSYDLEPTGLRLISNGWNCVFRVDTAAGPSVIRISRPVPGADDRSVRSEVEFMTALAAETDVAVPAVRRNRDGELVTMATAEGVPEARACVVFGWLGGPDLAARRSPANWARLGELMATMHRFAEEWAPSDRFRVADYGSCIPYGEPLVVFEPDRTELYGLEAILREATALTDRRIAELRREVPSIVLHGDLHQWNVKARRGVLSPFDFEDLLTGAPILDVATSLYYVRHDHDYADLARAFKSGYERRRPWVEREPGEMERLMFARSLDLLNAVLLDDSLELADDMEAFVRRREGQARVALGLDAPIVL
jgi:Ser/Thr protein kinase RdoA (MazF antagonist)